MKGEDDNLANQEDKGAQSQPSADARLLIS